ncbi:hypothetical protein PanWU01x14_194550 [Parasponia andersonii]|uniref:Uncharacterized protein n=1 Tax=Parasponia andersonii TaxID=3476 RepID=A0A2P5C0F5_PARAD|nr:hypothetical protein PanWU01x14_194550 [Parasponia andersonii]
MKVESGLSVVRTVYISVAEKDAKLGRKRLRFDSVHCPRAGKLSETNFLGLGLLVILHWIGSATEPPSYVHWKPNLGDMSFS